MPSDRRQELHQLAEQLRDPLRLRIVLTVLLLGIGYLAVCQPFNRRITEATRQLNEERMRGKLAGDVEFLRAQLEMLEDRLPKQADANEWIQYVIGGIREFPVQLTHLDSDKSCQLGPYEAISLRIRMEGKMSDLDAFLHWLETNERLFRVDSAKIEPIVGDGKRRSLDINVLGLNA